MKSILIEDKDVLIRGSLVKTAQLKDEYYVPVDDPGPFIARVRALNLKADLLTLVQEIHDQTPRLPFHYEWDDLAVLPLSTYENWLNKQITFKPRNKFYKAIKSGLVVKPVEFSDELVHSIMAVYNENPIRQGQRNRHYCKDFETVKREHSSFLDRSDFIGAFYNQKLIGFAKVTHVRDSSVFMNILSMISHRDKAPTNGLLAKTIEICTQRKSRFLNYSTWGKREGLNDFKEANGFQHFKVPRYYVPLTMKGNLVLRWNLHRPPIDYLPAEWVRWSAAVLSQWNQFRFGHIHSELSPLNTRNTRNKEGQETS